METYPFQVEAREPNLKASQIRKTGKIPAVLYGTDINENFTVTHKEVKKLIFTPEFRVGEVEVGGGKHKCIVKDIQWHPVTDQILHIDFLALKEGTKVKVEIPVKFKGVSPGIKAGGALVQTMRRVKVKLDPKDLVDELFIDISELELGEAVRVRDIELPDSIELMVNDAVPVATVEVPRALRSAEAADEEGAETPAEEGAATAETPKEEGS